MEIRRDPITQSWVVQGQKDSAEDSQQACPFDHFAADSKPILLSPPEGVAQVRVVPHPDPLYRIEGQPGRLAEGMYDKMGPTGAHEGRSGNARSMTAASRSSVMKKSNASCRRGLRGLWT